MTSIKLTDHNFREGAGGELGSKHDVQEIVLKQTKHISFETNELKTIFFQNFINFINSFTNLLHIKIDNYVFLMDDHICQLNKDLMRRIKSLCFDGCESLTVESFKFVNSYCSNLLFFGFTCSGGNVFYDIDTNEIISFIEQRGKLKGLSLTLHKLEMKGFSTMINCGHISGLMLNVYLRNDFTDSYMFLVMVMQLLATPSFDDVFIFQNSEHVGCFDCDSGKLIISALLTHGNLKNVDRFLIDVIHKRRGTILEVFFTGIVGLTCNVLHELTDANGNKLRHIEIRNCGEDISIETLKYLAYNSVDLKTVVISGGSKYLGIAGRRYSLGTAALLILELEDHIRLSDGEENNQNLIIGAEYV
jgi:hypothetical protein